MAKNQGHYLSKEGGPFWFGVDQVGAISTLDLKFFPQRYIL
jgi:hypothetical protein